MTLPSHGGDAFNGLDVVVRVDSEESENSHLSPGGTKGCFRSKAGTEYATVNIASDRLKENLERTVETLREMFNRISSGEEKFTLKEVQLSFEVSAKGGIRLIGTSEIEGKGGITLIFGTRD